MNIFKRKKEEVNNLNIFFNKAYQTHNVSRLSHLESLGLNFSKKKVIEIGAGVGDHTYYYLIKGAQVTSTDARQELVDIISQRFGNACFRFNAEQELDKFNSFEKYDIIHCYGLLYHINNPENFLDSLNKIGDLLLLETCVSNDFREDGPHLVSEDVSNPTQAISGRGCRPTRNWIYKILKRNFEYVYLPKTQPLHQEFPLDWTKPMEDRTSLIRAVFIASKQPIISDFLSTSVLKNYGT